MCGSLAGLGWHVPDAAQLPPPRAISKVFIVATREEDADAEEEVDASYSS